MKGINIETADYLLVFNTIITEGEKFESKYLYKGLEAWHDFDGYTCFLSYKDLTLTLLFHGKYSFDFSNKETMNEFVKKIKQLLKQLK